ncbi:hypothetical protein P7D52_07560 [Enterococcus dongliensis]|uniref:Uncharacterized protein n=1 Tax=Enterococcus dongliensis TaxID=2559925 RepID=A0AAP5KRF4_9ENTE|nr:hypothetical protein [Enterococcus dongliensis]MDT2596658.1 hypothetical protein [Enterococcus dongliensis]MDT2604185.1 hypothetical protein [Enterococcus dongliensis]MDT2634623.1 hypothetical protein [Enterococcus dongliensis]MDT2637553.1 hypothetical protein [Enterococcus dongliensis]MDT2642641.1 hypothetical protein [Enterococcus dongliensis]
MLNFQQGFPNTARYLKQKYPRKEPVKSCWHWGTLGLFSLLCIATIKQQLLLIGILILVAALIKGPGVLFFGALYSFLISLFPPIGIVLSALFFLLNIRLLTKSWRVNLVASLFYLYPLGMSVLRYLTQWDAPWQIGLELLPGLFFLHFVLIQVYYFHPNARQVAWTVFAIPFELLALILPKRFKKFFRAMPQTTKH